MAIPLTGNGGLFTRLGKMIALLNSVNLFRGRGYLNVTTISGSGTVVTVTTVQTTKVAVGDTVTISGSNIAGYNGTYTVATVASGTQFTLTNSATGTNTSTTVLAFIATGESLLSANSLVDNIWNTFTVSATGFPLDQFLVDSLYSNYAKYQTAHNGIQQFIQSTAQATVITMVNDDTRLPAQTLANAMSVLVSQMVSGSASVKVPTTGSIVTAAGTNNGHEVYVATILDDDGDTLDYLFADTINAVCATDSQLGVVAKGSETYTITSAAKQNDSLFWNWPLGAAVNTSITGVNPNLSQSVNILNNSGFETFTVSNVPDGWHINVGTAGVTVFAGGSGNANGSANCLQITGNGSELTEIRQQFGVDTTIKLAPLQSYSLIYWLKMSSVPAGGVLEFSLRDVSGTIINDQAGNANSLSVTLSGATTSYVAHTVTFRTPALLPATQFLRIKLTTALDNTVSAYIDDAATAKPTRLYAGGPGIVVFSSSNGKAIVGDSFTHVVSNKYDGQWQLAFQRLFNMTALGQQLPSGGSPTISDTLLA